MKIYYKKNKFDLEVKKCNVIGMFRGLMLRGRNTNNLLFEFPGNYQGDLHSFFVFFKFLVLWVDKENKVVDFKFCKPFMINISTEKKFHKIVELPFNNKNKKIISFFVDKETFK